MIRARWILLVVFLLSVLLISRISCKSQYLYTWDSVQFALSFERFNIAEHRPHPPGYLLYVWSGKALNSVVHDPNLTLISLSILATGFATLFIILLTLELLREADQKTRLWGSFGGALLYLTNPIVWFYGCVAEIYAFEGLFAALVAYLLILSNRKPAALIYGALALAVAGGFRPSTEAFLIPFFLLFWKGKNRKIVLSSILVLVAANLAWFLTLAMLSGGVKSYLGLLLQQFEVSVSIQDSLKRALKVLMRFSIAIGWPVIIAIGLKIRRLRVSRVEIKLLLLLLLPMTFFIFVFFPKDGYLMIVIPSVVILGVIACGRVYKMPAFVTIIALTIAMNCWIYLKPPITPVIRSQESGAQWFLLRIFTPNNMLIRNHDQLLSQFFHRADALYSGDKVFVTEVESIPDWRTIMYYRPNDAAILTFPDQQIPRVAKNHDYQLIQPPFRLSSHCLLLALPVGSPDLSMRSFELMGVSYGYAVCGELPQKFKLMSVPFERK